MGFKENLAKIRASKTYTLEMKYSGWRKKGVKKNGKEVKVQKTLSQIDLSVETGIPQYLISRYEAGLSLPAIGNILKLCNYFGITPNDLLKGEYKESTNE
jgi:transcriptional regulator with XRE-family HTH domain